VITRNGPETCARNCKADNEKRHHPEKSPPISVKRTVEPFGCTRCVTVLLDQKLAREHMHFLNEVEGMKTTMGELPERIVEQRRASLERLWIKRCNEEWHSATFSSRLCEVVSGEPLSKNKSEGPQRSFDIGNSVDRTSTTERGVDVKLSYQYLFSRALSGAPCPGTGGRPAKFAGKDSSSDPGSVRAKHKPLLDKNDLEWMEVADRFDSTNKKMQELTEQMHRVREADYEKPSGILARWASFTRKKS
jgi:hypothetical protein